MISSSITPPPPARVEILDVGRGSLQGTSVDSAGALHLLYSKTNAYTRIMSNVHGGTGQADLASIDSRDMATHGATTSFSGIGASVLHTINLPDFNLIAGGTIKVTSGIDNLALNSVGPDTQIQLRELPSTVTAGQSTTVSSSTPRDFNARGGVTLVPTLNQVGPLRLANDPTSTPTARGVRAHENGVLPAA